ncbi:MAG: arginine--tRNA ligase [Bacillota bacterium]|jgi:arginyl-tRNA synthetase
MSWVKKTKDDIYTMLTEAAMTAKEAGDLNIETVPSFVVEIPRDKTHGDFAANIAMLLAKQAKKAPRMIAEDIIKHLQTEGSYVADVEIAGAGFINFRLKENWLADGLRDAVGQGKAYGSSDHGKGKKVQVEFVSANPTGELHMGNARGAAIGDSLAAVLEAAGYDVEREFYVNDAGNQIEKFGCSLEARYLQQLGVDVEFPEDGYHGEDITRTMKEFIAEYGDQYLKADSESRKAEMVKYALDKKLADIRSGLSRFGVEYDVWFSEQSLHDSGAVKAVVDELEENGQIEEKDGAKWFHAERFGAEKPEVMIRANGIPTYYAADLAYHKNKFDRGFEKVINIWGADHHGHVARLKGAVEAIGYDPDKLDVILMQLVRLFQGGEIVRMSKRSGKYVTLQELMDDVGVDASRFFFVMRSADSQMDFDLDLAKSESSDNPVYYVQYAHARICSILQQAKEQGIELPKLEAVNFALLTDESEINLIKKILELPEEIVYSAENQEPHRIAVYALDMAGLFHSFYGRCRVLGVDADVQAARLYLCKAAAGCIAKALNLIGVKAPEHM